MLILTVFYVILLSQEEGFVDRVNFLIVMVILNPVRSIIHLVASPEMRRHVRLGAKMKTFKQFAQYYCCLRANNRVIPL